MATLPVFDPNVCTDGVCAHVAQVDFGPPTRFAGLEGYGLEGVR